MPPNWGNCIPAAEPSALGLLVARIKRRRGAAEWPENTNGRASAAVWSLPRYRDAPFSRAVRRRLWHSHRGLPQRTIP